MRFLAPLLAAGLLSVASSAPAAVDAGLLALVPPGTQLISGVHVSQSRLSPFGQFVIAQIQSHAGELQMLVDQTGFDPRKDVTELLIAFNGKPKNGAGLLLARGSFDPEKLKAAAVAKGATVEAYLGTDVLIGGGAAPDHHGGAVAFLSRTLAVAGDRESVRYAIAHANMSRPSGLNADLLARVESISAAADGWFVSVVPGTTVLPEALGASSSAGTGTAQAAAIQSIVQSSGSVHFGERIDLSFQAQTRSDKDASSLADVVRFVSSIVQMRRDNDPNFGPIATALDNMKLNASGNVMTVALSMPEKDFEQLANMHRVRRPAAARPEQKL